MSPLFIGTSGWAYDSWSGPFFPEDLPKKDRLHFYGTHFRATELNGVFYRTPELKTVRSWAQATPRGFRFAWKASRFITHWNRLGPKSRRGLSLTQARLKALGPKAGPVLFQLPPNFEADAERLDGFLKLVKCHLPRRRCVFEFRHPSWYGDDIISILRRHHVALCISDHHDAPAPWIVTARLVYVRGHGPGGRYRDRYPEKTLRNWARHIRQWRRERRTVHVYFDNDQKSAAPLDAMRLKEMLER